MALFQRDTSQPAWKKQRRNLCIAGVLMVLLAFVLGRESTSKDGILGWIGRWTGQPQPISSVAQIQRQDRLSQFAAMGVSPDSTVLLGDSLTHEGEWSQWLGPLVLNRGVSGDTTAALLQRLDVSLPSCPARVHVLAGVNDLLRNDPRLTVDAVENAMQNHRQLTRALAGRCPRTQRSIQALLPANCAMLASVLGWRCPADFEQLRARLNQRLAEHAAATGTAFIDLNERFSISGRPAELPPQLTHDGLHLNGQGYRRWATGLAQTWGLTLQAPVPPQGLVKEPMHALPATDAFGGPR